MKKAKYRRILLKLSGEVLRDPKSGECLSDAVLADMASQIHAVRRIAPRTRGGMAEPAKLIGQPPAAPKNSA